MPADPALLKALVSALEKEPRSVPLRLHVANLLLEAGAESAAMDHFTTVLAQEPANADALAGAARAADSLGDRDRAAGYRQLLAALGNPTQPARPRDLTPHADTAQTGQPAPESTDTERLGVSGAGQPLKAPAGPSESDQMPWWEVEIPDLTLKDVGGMEHVKRRLNVAFLGPMRNPALRKAYGKSLRGGLLLYGPPGCGKTFIARATAGELGARFIALGLADILDVWIGASEQRLHAIFEQARHNAPCVIFFDELDAIGQKRVHLEHYAAMRGVVNQFLSELDGALSSNEGVFVLGATNHPWDVDTALLRPGRFDRVLAVIPPDESARLAILKHHLKDRPTEVLDLRSVAAKTEGFSGADLAHLCETATETALEEAVSTGAVRPISNRDMQEALRQVKPSTRAWFETARNFVLFANQSGTYDDLMEYMKLRKLL